MHIQHLKQELSGLNASTILGFLDEHLTNVLKPQSLSSYKPLPPSLTLPCNVLQRLVVPIHGQVLHLELLVSSGDGRRAAGADAVLLGQRGAVHVDVRRSVRWRLLDGIAGLHGQG